MISRWPVVISVPLSEHDRTDDDRLTETAVLRLFDRARSVYLDRCHALVPGQWSIDAVVASGGARLAGARVVTVSAQVTEMFADSFVMTARLRPIDTDGVAGTASCSINVPGGVSEALRDELIALAHGAAYWH
jgi:hypothetical protein